MGVGGEGETCLVLVGILCIVSMSLLICMQKTCL